MNYSFSILLKDLASSTLTKITKLSDKLGVSGIKATRNYNASLKTVPKSVFELEQKLEQLRYRSDRSFTIKNIRKYNDQIRQTERELKRLRNLPPLSLSERWHKATRGLSGFIGIAGGLYLVKDSFQKMDDQMQASAQVQAGLVSTGGKVGYSLADIEKKASALQEKTIFGDESILQNVSAQLLTFTNITGEAFDGAQKAALDVTSRLKGTKATGEDLRGMAIKLGKALNDPVANLAALSDSGIQFSDSQKEVIKQMAETGQLAKAQALILKELDKQYGGSAESLAANGLGGMIQMKNLVGDLQEKLATGFMPVLKWVAYYGNKAATFMNEYGDAIGRALPWIVGAVLVFKTLQGVMTTYNLLQLLVTKSVIIWGQAQAAFNVIMSMNPVGLIIIGVIALIALIGYLVYKISGWGDAWKHTLQGGKLLFKSYVLFIKAEWNTLVNGLMIGINKILEAWYKFKNAVGLGDKSANNAALDKLRADTQARKEAIKSDWKEAIDTGKAGLNEFALAGKSLKWDKSKKLSDVTAGIKDQLGFGGGTGALSETETGDGGGGFAPDAGTSDMATTIAGGGAKQTHFNITIQKLQDDTKIYVSSAEQGIKNLGDKVQEELIRAINSINQIQTAHGN